MLHVDRNEETLLWDEKCRGFIALLVMAADMWTITSASQSGAATGAEVFQIGLIFILPVSGPLIWLVIGLRKQASPTEPQQRHRRSRRLYLERSSNGQPNAERRVQMLRSVKSLYGFRVIAEGGEAGKVHEFYFDDEAWAIRYLVADSGGWLAGRKVLIAPVVFGSPDWATQEFPILLKKEQVEDLPGVDQHKPVSRRHQLELFRSYGWRPYFLLAGYYGVPSPGPQKEQEPGAAPLSEEEGDPHLRSTREVIGYHIQASDGEIGHAEDLILDDDSWIIRYLAVNTRNWLPGRKVLVSPQWIREISWQERKISIDLDREKIKASPEYDPSAPVNREYEEVFYDYYGRPHYWL